LSERITSRLLELCRGADGSFDELVATPRRWPTMPFRHAILTWKNLIHPSRRPRLRPLRRNAYWTSCAPDSPT